MTSSSIEILFLALNKAGIRYLTVGGLAVIAHGYLRLTMDVDLLVALDTSNVKAALQVFTELGYVPRAPVPMEQFADPRKRREWVEQKGLKAFSLFSAAHPETEVDLFIDDPLGFEEAYARAKHVEYVANVSIPVCGVADLLKLKRQANRPKDKIDIEKLKILYPDVS